jgi:hypothetical protein
MAPGTAKTSVAIGNASIVLDAGAPDAAWCRRHWIKRFGAWDLFVQSDVDAKTFTQEDGRA